MTKDKKKQYFHSATCENDPTLNFHLKIMNKVLYPPSCQYKIDSYRVIFTTPDLFQIDQFMLWLLKANTQHSIGTIYYLEGNHFQIEKCQKLFIIFDRVVLIVVKPFRFSFKVVKVTLDEKNKRWNRIEVNSDIWENRKLWFHC